jgi:cytochrome bd-type quinol oxidase subunit 2
VVLLVAAALFGLALGQWSALAAALALGGCIAVLTNVDQGQRSYLGLTYGALCGAGIAVGVVLRRHRQIHDNARPQANAWVILGVVWFLVAGVLFMFGLAGATDDVGSSWSNSDAHKLNLPIAVSAGLGLACLIRAWMLVRRT